MTALAIRPHTQSQCWSTPALQARSETCHQGHQIPAIQMTLRETAHCVFAPVRVLRWGFPVYPMLLSCERLVTSCLTFLCAVRQRHVSVLSPTLLPGHDNLFSKRSSKVQPRNSLTDGRDRTLKGICTALVSTLISFQPKRSHS